MKRGKVETTIGRWDTRTWQVDATLPDGKGWFKRFHYKRDALEFEKQIQQDPDFTPEKYQMRPIVIIPAECVLTFDQVVAKITGRENPNRGTDVNSQVNIF